MAFRNCQQRWKIDYVDGKRSKAYGVHLDFGTAVHGAIEKHKTRVNPLNVDNTLHEFELLFNQLYDTNSINYKNNDLKNSRQYFVDAGKNIINRLHECDELNSAEVVYNEYELNQPIERSDNIKINFKGYIDIVLKTTDKHNNTILYVCDFKTCSWGWNKEKRSSKDLHFQILLYKHFLCKKFNINPSLVRTAFILLKKKPNKKDSPIEWFQISASSTSVQYTLDELNANLTEMNVRLNDNTLIKNWNACTNDFGEVCPYSNSKDCVKDA